MKPLTVEDVLNIITATAQKCREEGITDMRTIIHKCDHIRTDYLGGDTREEILKAHRPELFHDDPDGYSDLEDDEYDDLEDDEHYPFEEAGIGEEEQWTTTQ